jgi:DNA-binding MarR family transcriptional regulator
MSVDPPAFARGLTAEQSRAWVAYMQVGLRMTYEMNRQLQDQSGLSLADYHVLVALADARDGRMQLSDLAARIGWERSRTSHHLLRMCRRGLVMREASTTDGRATDAVLTDVGRDALAAAAPGHAQHVRRLFFDGIDDRLLVPLREALEQAYRSVATNGTLPDPPGQ